MQVAACTRLITPQNPLPMAGFANRNALSEGVHDDLEINAVAMKVEHGKIALMLSFDVLFIGKNVTDTIKTYAYRTYKIEAAQIMLFASHTHFAPHIDDQKPALGACDKSYIGHVIQTAYDAIDEAVKGLKSNPDEFSLYHGRTQWSGAINRRHPVMLALGKIGLPSYMARHSVGFVDRNIHVIAFKNKEDKIAAAFISVACHPVSFPRNEISSDFIGIIRTTIREQYGAIPIIFAQGFSGDVRPDITSSMYGLKFGNADYTAWLQWSRKIAQTTLQTFQSKLQRSKNSDAPSLSLTLKPMDTLFKTIEKRGSLPDHLKIHSLQIGDKIIVACNAEMLSRYAKNLPENVIPVGCLEDTFGYLPHKNDTRWGGYEVSGSQSYMGFAATLKHTPLSSLELAKTDAV